MHAKKDLGEINQQNLIKKINKKIYNVLIMMQKNIWDQRKKPLKNQLTRHINQPKSGTKATQENEIVVNTIKTDNSKS